MKSKGNAPTAEQKRFYDWAVQVGCAICFSHAEVHHVVGSSCRSNKIRIGNWYILPLCYHHHREKENPENVTDWKKRFEKKHGTQKELFFLLVGEYWKETGNKPFSQEVFNAIQDHN